jgi:ankyrin repeat protein
MLGGRGKKAMNGSEPALSDSAMTTLIRAGQWEPVEQLLKGGLDINARNQRGRTLLIAATDELCYSPDMWVERLLALGADVNAQDKNGFAALHFAALGGHVRSLKMLIDAGAKLDLVAARKVGSTSHYVSGTPLHCAAYYEYETQGAAVRELLQAGADPLALDEDGHMPIHVACRGRNSVPALKALLERCEVDVRDSRGHTALHHAAELNPDDSIRVLLEAGADVNAQAPSTGKRPIHVAAESSESAVRALLDAGAALDARLKNGRTPLLIAVAHKRYGICELLLKAGADADAVDSDGVSPLLEAAARANLHAAQALLAHGAARDLPLRRDKKIAGKQLKAGDTPRSIAVGKIAELFIKTVTP